MSKRKFIKMSKRKKPPIFENKELSISKAKKSLRKKTQLTGENNLETPVQTFQASNSSSKAAVVEATQECEGTSLKKSNQGGKLVPVFTKQKKPLTEWDFGETATIWTEQVQQVDRNVLDTTKNAAQNAVASSEPLKLMDLFVAKVENAGDRVILRCEEVSERLDVKMQEQDRIRRVNNDDANAGFVDAHQRTGAEPNLQASICEKEMPEKQVSFFLYTPDNEDVGGLEKRKFSVKSLNYPLVKEMNVAMLEEDRITDHTKSNQNEEDHLSSLDMGMEQDKAIQDIIKLADIEEANWTEKGSRKGVGLDECIVSQLQEENSITRLSLVTNLPVSTSGEQSNYPCMYSVVKQGSTDAKEGNQSHSYINGKTEGQNVICSITEPGVTQCESKISEKATDQQNLWTSEKLVDQSGRERISAQSSFCRRKTSVAEQNSVKVQDISGKVLPETQSGCIYLGKEANLSELKCEQVIVRSNLLFQSENRKTSVQEVVCTEEMGKDEKETGMKADLAKSATASPDPEVPVLLTQQQQKENSCVNLMSNTKQPEFDRFDLRPNEIVETLRGIGQQTLAKIPKAETKEKLTENSLISTDAHLDGKEEMVMCVENKSKPVHVESGLSSVEVLPTLREMGDFSREHNADSDTQRSLLASRTGSSMTVPSVFDTRAQTCSPCADPLSLDLEFLPDSQLQGIFESDTHEFLPHKSAFLDNPHTCTTDKSDQCAAGGENGTKTLAPVLTHRNNARDEVIERICDPSKQEDATDVVCGLIKELSNLNSVRSKAELPPNTFMHTAQVKKPLDPEQGRTAILGGCSKRLKPLAFHDLFARL